MCNLYSITRTQEAMRRLFAVSRDLTGNLPPRLPEVFPDQMAPIVRAADAERQIEMMRWGMPGPPQFDGAPVTNIRNTKSPHWRRWLGPHSRCLVPVNSFCEWADTKPKKTPTWFALDDARPLFAFAGIWTPWRGVRGTKANPIDAEHQLYGFLTTAANGVVGPVHPKAMPVLLTRHPHPERDDPTPARGSTFRRHGRLRRREFFWVIGRCGTPTSKIDAKWPTRRL